MSASVVFAPLVGWWLIYALAGAAVVLVAVALWWGLSGWWLRALALAALVLALAYENYGHVGVPMLAHALFNLNTIALVLAGFPS